MDAADLRLFDAALRDVAASRTGDDLDTALDALGWRDALLDSPSLAAHVVFGVLGEHAASASAIDDVLAVALGVEPTDTTSVLLPVVGGHEPPATLIDDRVIIHGVGTRRMPRATTVVLGVSDGGHQYVATVDPSQLELRSVTGMDPDGGWQEVHADLTGDSLERVSGAEWSDAIIAGQLGVSAELVGLARTMVAMARSHAVERIQFGVPIASFQAVRHRLADALFAVESADGAVAASAEEPSAYTAAMAKAIAGRSAKTVARHAQQVLAGMGFTTEHDFHRYLQRSLVLDQLFGSSATLSEAIGAEVLRSGVLPPVRKL